MNLRAADFPALRTRRRTGREGKRLETLIASSSSPATALLTQVPTASRMIRTPRGLQAVQMKSPADFFGLHVASGRLIVIDAKECAEKHRLVTNADHLAEHQRLELCRYGHAGAIAGLIALRTTTGDLYFVSWRRLVKRVPSIQWDELPGIGSASFAVDWGRVVKAADEEDGL